MSLILPTKTEIVAESDTMAINNIKSLSIDMIASANSGHYGIALSAAPIIYTLYTRHMIFDKTNPDWIDRDRFVMSCGHGSALLYSTLFMCGFLTIDDLKNFRQLGSKTPGHPEYTTPGVDATTGLLGQGIANAVGMAIGEQYLNNRYQIKKGTSVIDHYTYVLCSDGDLMEGISYEACSLAGTLGLGKLIILYDSNNMTLDHDTTNVFTESISDRFKSMNFDVHYVKDGNSIEEIDNAIKKAKSITDKPSIIEIKTILGKGSKLENTPAAHGKLLEAEDIKRLKEKLGMRDIMFTVYKDSLNYVNTLIDDRNNQEVKNWNLLYEKNISKLEDYKQEEIQKLINKDYSLNLDNLYFDKEDNLLDQGRDISGIILNRFVDEKNIMMGGSCDVATSTKAYLKNMKDFSNNTLNGKNILFGVREHAMGGILNGLLLLGIRCFGSTFLAFSDYLKPSLRMAALMNLPVLYIFTHDSILIGEDGPTHQPIEQLSELRNIPNVTLYRPYDANEILGSFKSALSNLKGPSIIVLNKETNEPSLNTSINEVDKGGYLLINTPNSNGTIIATGSEVKVALSVYEKLKEIGIHVDIVTMPSLNKFLKQDMKYQKEVLSNDKILVIEYGISVDWNRFTDEENIISISRYGTSAPKEKIIDDYSINIESIYEEAKRLFK